MTPRMFIVAGVINFVSVCHAMMYPEILSIAEHGFVFRKRHVNQYDAVAVSGCFFMISLCFSCFLSFLDME